MVATTLVALFKHEVDRGGSKSSEVGSEDTEPLTPKDDGDGEGEEELELGVFETYSMLWKIVCLPLMPGFIALLLTQKVRKHYLAQKVELTNSYFPDRLLRCRQHHRPEADRSGCAQGQDGDAGRSPHPCADPPPGARQQEDNRAQANGRLPQGIPAKAALRTCLRVAGVGHTILRFRGRVVPNVVLRANHTNLRCTPGITVSQTLIEYFLHYCISFPDLHQLHVCGDDGLLRPRERPCRRGNVHDAAEHPQQPGTKLNSNRKDVFHYCFCHSPGRQLARYFGPVGC